MFLEFTQFIPTAIEARHVSIRSDSVTYFFHCRTGDLFCTRICASGTDFDVAETYDEVKGMILNAEAKDRMGT
jgi:hypothetical protein